MDFLTLTHMNEALPIDLLHILLVGIVLFLTYRLSLAGKKMSNLDGKLINQEDRSLNTALGVPVKTDPSTISTVCPQCNTRHEITGHKTHVVLS